MLNQQTTDQLAPSSGMLDSWEQQRERHRPTT